MWLLLRDRSRRLPLDGRSRRPYRLRRRRVGRNGHVLTDELVDIFLNPNRNLTISTTATNRRGLAPFAPVVFLDWSCPVVPNIVILMPFGTAPPNPARRVIRNLPFAGIVAASDRRWSRRCISRQPCSNLATVT